ncbi:MULTISPECIES: lysine exporter LysO family protein [Providencia]|uniref:lysine exporter LysO family protein n=1 Tax=Providencia TaxID=586 RepID=UPI00197D21EA|nr:MULTISPECIES: lysine exporter LysO family protein [Providencia]HEC8328947.1 lysine exporter LysO family protein [Providencia rettgeri]MBN4866157.1 lysine exporter LysO family protein [Providencia stuartii]MBN4875650.1 lysine exporter LysO family protein [Providencia stuartii]MBN4880342.1 lysine exporter LysO family protein [Providencia stuartii]MBN4884850.1 lysine exporter LysO family protein [Providencia stuartii]
MYSGLLIILLPLTLGYLIPIKNKQILHRVHQSLNSMVYVILFLMGITLALLENLSEHLFSILIYAITFFACIFSLNIISLLLLDKLDPWKIPQHKQEKPPSRIKMVLESLQLCGVLLLGFIVGLTGFDFLHYADKGSQIALMLLLLLVGIQLRNSGMSIKQILINRRGTTIAFVMGISALAGGALAALLLGLPVKMGLALASGFGWYSLTGIVLTDAYGPVMGSAAFFNDLARELAAIMLIPIIINRYRSTALGICGSTSMDFTLPVLQRSGGVSIVPAAIVHGFVLSLITPILMAFFT